MGSEVLQAIAINMKNIGIGIGIFAISYLSYMAFSTYYNVRLLKQKYDKQKTIESIIKIVCVGLGTGLLGLGITTLPIFANSVGFTIPEEYQKIFSNIALLGIYLTASIKYLVEAFSKMGKIVTPNLNVDDEIKQNQIKELKDKVEKEYFAQLTADSEEIVKADAVPVEENKVEETEKPASDVEVGSVG